MTKKKRRRLCIAAMLALGIVLLLPVRTVQAYEKKTIYNSPYVSFSPTGKHGLPVPERKDIVGMKKIRSYLRE